MPLIDVHSHPVLSSWEHAYDESGLPRFEGRLVDDLIGLDPWSPDVFLTAMERNDVQAMVMSWPKGASIARGSAAKELARAMNEEMAGIVRDHPDRFGGFAALPTDDVDAMIEEAIFATESLGLEGICLPTNVDGVYLGDDRFVDLFAECNRRCITVFAHPVTPDFFQHIALPYAPSVMEYMFDTTRMLTSLVYSGRRTQFPDFPLIATHAGGVTPFLSWRLATSAGFLGVGGDRVMDADEVWAGLKSFHFDLTTAPALTSLTSVLELVPPSQLLMGTDSPIRPQRNITMALHELEVSSALDETQRNQIRGGTALSLFPRLAASIAESTRQLDAPQDA